MVLLGAFSTFQIDLALDVEIALPKSIMHRAKSIVQKERVYPNRQLRTFSNLWRKALALAEGDLAQKHYLPQAINSEVTSIVDNASCMS